MFRWIEVGKVQGLTLRFVELRWVHTDPLAFGGPRPVYTLRYLEPLSWAWGIARGVVFHFLGDHRSQRTGQETSTEWNEMNPVANHGPFTF